MQDVAHLLGLDKRSAYLIQYAQVTPCAVPAVQPVRAPARIHVSDPAMFARWALEEAWHGNCVAPVPLLLQANHINVTTGEKGVLSCRATVRCRKCPECRDQAARMWMARAISEACGAQRTWFVTLTFDWRMKPCDRESQWPYARRQFTLFLKRLRKRGCGLRYLAVFEAHKDGRPHIHCLLHEKIGSRLQWKDVEAEWRQGFHKTKLTRGDPAGSARYVTKYLFKEGSRCRVRASIKYGAQRKDAAAPATATARQGEAVQTIHGLHDTPHLHLLYARTGQASEPPARDARSHFASVASNSAFLTRDLYIQSHIQVRTDHSG